MKGVMRATLVALLALMAGAVHAEEALKAKIGVLRRILRCMA